MIYLPPIGQIGCRERALGWAWGVLGLLSPESTSAGTEPLRGSCESPPGPTSNPTGDTRLCFFFLFFSFWCWRSSGPNSHPVVMLPWQSPGNIWSHRVPCEGRQGVIYINIFIQPPWAARGWGAAGCRAPPRPPQPIPAARFGAGGLQGWGAGVRDKSFPEQSLGGGTARLLPPFCPGGSTEDARGAVAELTPLVPTSAPVLAPPLP